MAIHDGVHSRLRKNIWGLILALLLISGTLCSALSAAAFSVESGEGFRNAAEMTYNDEPKTTTLTISNTMEGSMDDPARVCRFTVRIFDNAGLVLNGEDFGYKISNASGATVEADTMTLDIYGEWSFCLRHGDSVVINGIAPDSYIQVIEDRDAGYETFFTDSDDTASTQVIGRNTTMLAMTKDPREIDFTNERVGVPWTAFDEPETINAFTIMALLIVATGFFVRLSIRLNFSPASGRRV